MTWSPQPMSPIAYFQPKSWQQKARRTWTLLIVSYFALSCCDSACPSDPLEVTDLNNRSECCVTMHCELCWFHIKINNQLSISTDPFGTVSHFIEQYLINSLGEWADLSEKYSKFTCSLIGIGLGRSVSIKFASHVEKYIREDIFDETTKFSGCSGPKKHEPLTSGSHLVSMCNKLHISVNEATLKSVICRWEFIPVVHGLVFVTSAW